MKTSTKDKCTENNALLLLLITAFKFLACKFMILAPTLCRVSKHLCKKVKCKNNVEVTDPNILNSAI